MKNPASAGFFVVAGMGFYFLLCVRFRDGFAPLRE
jgi:hypothetical protein